VVVEVEMVELLNQVQEQEQEDLEKINLQSRLIQLVL
tara:strand:+ start:44 stop:154 length:111 start_codon:yes stop_codon:yes gene_type:complete